MKQLVFSDAQYWEDFQPLSFTRPIAEMRVGILTFKERWQKLLEIESVSYITEDYLQNKFPKPEPKESLFIVPNFIPSETIIPQIKNLKMGQALVYENEIVAAHLNMDNFSLNQIEEMIDIEEELIFFKKPWDLFTHNEKAIDFDFDFLTKDKTSQELSPTNGFLGNSEDLFIEKGAHIEFSTINCKSGKVYIGKNVEIMEGSMVRGPFALCDHSKINMGAKIYGATTIGPYCKIGGEINNVVVFGYSNKGHDGFLGNSVIGEWCNLGADTNSSNLKNDYGKVKIWSYKDKKFINSDLQFLGIIMGDHSKTAINTQLNTGTVIGVAANIFRSGFLPNLVKSFSWGGFADDEKILLKKSLETANIVMERRNCELSEEDKETLGYIHDNF